MPDQVEPEVPQKPIRSKKWGLIVVAAVIGMFILLDLLTSIHMTAPPAKRSSSQIQPTPAASMQGFQSRTDQLASDLSKNHDALQKAIDRAKDLHLGDLLAPLPDCDEAMRAKLGGHYYVTAASDGTRVQLTCEANDKWAVIPDAAASIQPLTPPQEAAHAGGGATAADQRRQERAAKRLAALNSSSVALDFVEQKHGAVEQSAAATQVASTPAAPTAKPEAPKYAWDAAGGPNYIVFEGTVLETVLTNRLNGEFSGPVNVMLTTDLYSHDHQHLLMPQGTRILGEAIKVSTQEQRRLAVVFHRAIMPDGYSLDFDQFAGLDQQGASGLTGRVNTHWAKVIGTAVLVGAIGGLAQVGGGYSSALSPGLALENGITAQSGQQATQILDRALNVLPTVTVYEGTRVRIWVQKDLGNGKDSGLPAYENHTVNPSL